VGAVITLLLGLAGCWLFNVLPEASFTISAQTGQAPFTVNFSALLSSDEDGVVVQFEWDFGDGTSGTGRSVSHTYTTAGTFVVVLRVTDDDGDSDTTQKTIYITPAEPEGPTAAFTASPTSGTSPLTSYFNASSSSYADGAIARYDWDFGDGRKGSGMNTSHTYFSTGNQSFTVTLTVTGTDGKTGTATRTVSITVPGGGGTTPDAGAPSARFDIVEDSLGVAPFQATFDPSDSEADEGAVLATFLWTFGDGTSTSDISANNKTHVYTTNDPSEIFSVMLAVYDNNNATDSIIKTVKAYNHQPVAGFEIANPPGGDGGGGDVEYNTEAAAWAADVWEAEDVVYGSLGVAEQTVSVVIRSMRIDDGVADRWFKLTATAEQKDLETATTSATTSTTPEEPSGYEDHNFSYDPEGQQWVGDAWPNWFPNQAWGIRWLYIDWGDNTALEQVNYNVSDAVFDGDTLALHAYEFTGTARAYTITVTAEDWLGATSSYSRKVFLKAGIEAAEEL